MIVEQQPASSHGRARIFKLLDELWGKLQDSPTGGFCISAVLHWPGLVLIAVPFPPKDSTSKRLPSFSPATGFQLRRLRALQGPLI